MLAIAESRAPRRRPAYTQRDERERALRENIAALADEYFADFIQGRDDEWDCPACRQVDRVLGRFKEGKP